MSDDTVTLPDGFAAQVQEAQAPPRPRTKMVMWRERTWIIRDKPNARFLAAYEDDKIMTAIKALLGEKQFDELLELDPDIEGDDGMEGFIAACNRAWGVSAGN